VVGSGSPGPAAAFATLTVSTHRSAAGRVPRTPSGGALFAEIGEEQGEAALSLAGARLPQAQIAVERDLSGLDRVLVVYR